MEEKMVRLITDGASRNNPGQAAIGYLIEDLYDRELARYAEPIGIATNNQAEYLALVQGLGQCKLLGATHVLVTSDSQLVMCQMRGEYRIKDRRLCHLRDRAMQLVAGFASVRFVDVPRTNPKVKVVDRYINQALDAHLSQTVGGNHATQRTRRTAGG